MDVYMVWGPTAEWGDGAGPLGYYASRTEAEAAIADYRTAIRDASLDSSWPFSDINLSVVEQKAEDLDVPRVCLLVGMDAVLEYLNAS